MGAITAALPPEITSALIHTGPGSGPLIAAAQAWQQLGTQLEAATDSIASTITGLNGTWLGPSADAMRAAASRYVNWLRATTAQVLQNGAAANMAAAAASTVRSAVSTPAEVAANRAQLAVLTATNIFGQNTAAIAANEAQYQAMWARNTAAMNAYQASSQQATAALAPVDPPPAVANPPVAAAAPVAAAPATPLGNLINTLSSLVTPLGTPSTGDLLATLVGYTGGEFGSFPWSMLQVLAQFDTAQGTNATANDIAAGLGSGYSAIGGGEKGTGVGGGSFGTLAPAANASASMPITATMGKGVAVGGLTAPPAAANIKLASTVTPLPETPGFGGPIIAPPPMPRAASAEKKETRWKTGKEIHDVVMPRPPSGG